jgi:hypothetical protein
LSQELITPKEAKRGGLREQGGGRTSCSGGRTRQEQKSTRAGQVRAGSLEQKVRSFGADRRDARATTDLDHPRREESLVEDHEDDDHCPKKLVTVDSSREASSSFLRNCVSLTTHSLYNCLVAAQEEKFDSGPRKTNVVDKQQQ